MSIEVVNESGYDGVNEESLADVATFVLREMDIHPSAEVTVSVVDVPTMSELHLRWMGLEGPTDVMSFPMDELTPNMGRPDSAGFGPAMLGDIILCPESPTNRQPRLGTIWGMNSASSPPTAACTCWATTTSRRNKNKKCLPCKMNS